MDLVHYTRRFSSCQPSRRRDQLELELGVTFSPVELDTDFQQRLLTTSRPSSSAIQHRACRSAILWIARTEALDIYANWDGFSRLKNSKIAVQLAQCDGNRLAVIVEHMQGSLFRHQEGHNPLIGRLEESSLEIYWRDFLSQSEQEPEGHANHSWKK